MNWFSPSLYQSSAVLGSADASTGASTSARSVNCTDRIVVMSSPTSLRLHQAEVVTSRAGARRLRAPRAMPVRLRRLRPLALLDQLVLVRHVLGHCERRHGEVLVAREAQHDVDLLAG